jgi:serine phosphatase RsbU (regulator of sigma subunit)/pSer/pThr/pTyr-binding forkhead associated (FHA) protein
MAKLQVDRGDLERQSISLDHDKIVLGRSLDCDAVISKNEAVGRWHAQILRVHDRHYIEDHRKSKNRTYVNEEAIPYQTRILLKHGDHIRICEFEATFNDGYSQEIPKELTSTVEAMLSSKSEHSLESQPASKLAVLLEITAKLSKTLQLDSQLPEVAEGLLRLFPQADRCFLIMVDEETDELQPKVVRTRAAAGDESLARFSHTIVRQCLRTAQAILLSERDKIPLSSSESVISAQMRSVMCVPLCPAEGKPFGVIQLDTQDQRKLFTEDDLRLLWGVAHQATAALENTRYHELRLMQMRVKNELEMARSVQLHFLPLQLPEVPGYEFFSYYEAAREVGGDYYDFVPLSENRLAVTIGDVAGKGMPAALLMAKLSSESRFCFLTERQPISAVRKLNNQLYPVTSPMDRFVTFIAAVLDPATHTVTLVNAGHPSPFLYRTSQREFGKAMHIDLSGQSLGHQPSSDYECLQLKLEPGDSLLLFSDGVTDAQSAEGKPFRNKGILSVLDKNKAETPRTLGERLVKAMQRHASGVAPYDDITLLCFGRKM